MRATTWLRGVAVVVGAGVLVVAPGCAPRLQWHGQLMRSEYWNLDDSAYAAVVAANQSLKAETDRATSDPLGRAIIERRHGRVRALIKVGADVRRPLQLEGVVEEIAHRKHARSGAWASLSGRQLRAQPLHIAALKADAAMVQILIAAGAPVDGGGEFTPLVAATDRAPSDESAAIVETLLAAGAHADGLAPAPAQPPVVSPVDCSATHPQEAWHPQCASQCAPLQRVLMRPNRRDEGWLSGYVIDRRASGTNGDLVVTTEMGHWPSTPEMRAPRERIVRALLAAGASADPPRHWHHYFALRTTRDALGTYPRWRTCPVALWAGIHAGLSDETVLALSGKTKYPPGSGWKEEVFDGLEVLALERREALVARVLREQLPRLEGHERVTALDLVATRGAADLVATLLRAGVKPTNVDNAGRGYAPAIVSAAEHCDRANVPALLRAGADPNRQRSSDGARALNVACPDVSALLQDAGGTATPKAEQDRIVAERAAEVSRLQRQRSESRRRRAAEFAAEAGELRGMTREWEAQRQAAERRRQAERESTSRAVAQGLQSGLEHAKKELAPPKPPPIPYASGSASSAAGDDKGASKEGGAQGTQSQGGPSAPAAAPAVGSGARPPAGAAPPQGGSRGSSIASGPSSPGGRSAPSGGPPVGAGGGPSAGGGSAGTGAAGGAGAARATPPAGGAGAGGSGSGRAPAPAGGASVGSAGGAGAGKCPAGNSTCEAVLRVNEQAAVARICGAFATRKGEIDMRRLGCRGDCEKALYDCYRAKPAPDPARPLSGAGHEHQCRVKLQGAVATCQARCPEQHPYPSRPAQCPEGKAGNSGTAR
ncbi:MAG TPA: hypothetical protein PK141_11530 [Polyangiaceae bacterium]|nr:hypothetical protein [Polyangiaceae bacterium]